MRPFVNFSSSSFNLSFKLFLCVALVACVSLLLSGPSLAAVQFGPADYVVTQQAGDSEPTITAAWGSWTGYIAYTATMSSVQTHELVFEFESPDYFSGDHLEHWAVAVRADGETDTSGNGDPNTRGRGVIIGNVSDYVPTDPTDPSCGPTQSDNAIAMEAFWTGGNCVFGPTTESQPLTNNTRYKLHVISRMWSLASGTLENEYQLWEKVGGVWQLLNVEMYREPPEDNPAPASLGGFFLSTLNDEHPWTFYIYNLTSYKCAYGEDQCSN